MKRISAGRRRRCLAFGALIIFCGSAYAAEIEHALTPGLYKIDVLLGRPDSGQLKPVKQVEKCLSADAIANHTVFDMLSDSPVAQCPKYDVCAGQFRTGFVAQCLGSNAQSAIGMFALEPKEFRGRIDIKDGNGNVLQSEIQYGDRVGNCVSSPAR
ncbi:MAG TPA: hypothetical protein VKV77_10760 [Methylovirgula sp.]|nr:hypothetical protein [Methylovirgula sp.]